MKIKTWLLLSYFIVMTLPLVAVYFLYAWVTSYHDEKQVEEYFQVYETIHHITPHLESPELYEARTEKNEMDELQTNGITISLYNRDGILLYGEETEIYHTVPKDILFQNLYELNQELRFFTYKQPVFQNGDLIGLYEIKVPREELMENIIRRGWIVTTVFITSFILIYAIMAFILHRRLDKRLQELMSEMSAFASGTVKSETATGKDEIGELKQHFYAMRKQILAAQEVIQMEQQAKEYMVATISHDLKTPLTSIKAYAESLDTAENLTEEDRRLYRQVIIEKADFMKQMIDDLITHTLLQKQDYELALVPVDGAEFFDMLVSGYEPLCAEKQIQLIIQSNVIGMYAVHPEQLVRVVDNVMTNAIRHAKMSGRVWLAAQSKQMDETEWLFDAVTDNFTFDYDHYAYIIVQNEGAGIKEENMRYLFDPLYQVDKARSKKADHGTGLGLAITKQIIEKHGGDVYAFSDELHGTCFICSIPKERGETNATKNTTFLA